MAYTVRKAAKKKIDNAYNNLDWAMKHLLTVAGAYKLAHPDISDFAESIAQGLLIIQGYIQELDKRI